MTDNCNHDTACAGITRTVLLTPEEQAILSDTGGRERLARLIRLSPMLTSISINPKFLTKEEQEEFIEGWIKAGGYDDDRGPSDNPDDQPWCMPWRYSDDIAVVGFTPAEWGASYWHSRAPVIRADLAEERRRRERQQDEYELEHDDEAFLESIAARTETRNV